ncbi:MAG: hypothetical protein GTN76_10840 [Candidatus Aenigmarchaeota archaeon]|nr:hypothetical protein [Candidatus Aenigmarchaeota archaeon]
MKIDKKKIDELREKRKEALEGIFNAYEETVSFLLEENESLWDMVKQKDKEIEQLTKNGLKRMDNMIEKEEKKAKKKEDEYVENNSIVSRIFG